MVFAFLNGRFEPLFIDMDDGGAMRRVICFLRLSNNQRCFNELFNQTHVYRANKNNHKSAIQLFSIILTTF